ncbi:MAG: tRNA epoxyqueuosine(34) reductase QueG [Chloroflexota bacterium]
MPVETGAARDAATVKRLGREAGFDLVRIAHAGVMDVEGARSVRWIQQGRQGEMRWMTGDRAAAAADPSTVLACARSVISVGVAYWSGARPPEAVDRGKIARYAWGPDYHTVLGEALDRFAASLAGAFGAEYRWFVDTGPVMDKAWAARSGMGWYGRNTNILTEKFGSFVLLGEIVSSLDLPADAALDRDCGQCRLCVSACPTGALDGDYAIDARKCISYLTIELRGPIPLEYRDAIGSWVFGCDICQDVCPPTMAPYLKGADDRQAWALEVRKTLRPDDVVLEVDYSTHQAWTGRNARKAVDLPWLLRLSHDAYVEAFRGTAIKRAKVWMLRRNAAVALGNVGSRESAADLCASLQGDEHPIVRGHAAWALGKLQRRHPGLDMRPALVAALDGENDSSVRAEIMTVLA